MKPNYKRVVKDKDNFSIHIKMERGNLLGRLKYICGDLGLLIKYCR